MANYDVHVLRITTEQINDDGAADRELGLLGQDGWYVAAMTPEQGRNDSYIAILHKLLSN